MEIDWEAFVKPLIMVGVCLVAVVIVFCANALPELAESEGSGKKVKYYFVWAVVLTVIVVGVLGFIYMLKVPH